MECVEEYRSLSSGKTEKHWWRGAHSNCSRGSWHGLLRNGGAEPAGWIQPQPSERRARGGSGALQGSRGGCVHMQIPSATLITSRWRRSPVPRALPRREGGGRGCSAPLLGGGRGRWGERRARARGGGASSESCGAARGAAAAARCWRGRREPGCPALLLPVGVSVRPQFRAEGTPLGRWT